MHAAQMAALRPTAAAWSHQDSQGQDVQVEPAVDPSVAERHSMLMQRTVRCGTLSQEFRHALRTESEDLTIGARAAASTATIPRRRNWFVGFARENPTGEAIAIGCLLVLNERSGSRRTPSPLVIRHTSRSAGKRRQARADANPKIPPGPLPRRQ